LVRTTKNNPAAFQKAPRPNLIYIIRKLMFKVVYDDIRSAYNYFISEVLNYYHRFSNDKHFYCNLCNTESNFFINTSNNKRILYNSICPNCSSRKRHRGLYEIYKLYLKKIDSPNILHFAPEPVFYNLFKSYQYITSDLHLTDVDIKLDIENIDYKSNSFNMVLCNHVLEHVFNDIIALEEIYRILSPSGLAIITVPGNWHRNKTLSYKEPDSNGHYRDYGLEFFNILKKIFNKIEIIDLYNYNNCYHLPIGLTPKHDLALVCYKN